MLARVAPGTPLRDGLERILRGRTGALIVLGYDHTVEDLCDGGFSVDIDFSPTRLRELCKMDGAVMLTDDATADPAGERPADAGRDHPDRRVRHPAPHRRTDRAADRPSR